MFNLEIACCDDMGGGLFYLISRHGVTESGMIRIWARKFETVKTAAFGI